MQLPQSNTVNKQKEVRAENMQTILGVSVILGGILVAYLLSNN